MVGKRWLLPSIRGLPTTPHLAPSLKPSEIKSSGVGEKQREIPEAGRRSLPRCFVLPVHSFPFLSFPW
ncbi:hypothetical protein BHM03_00046688 [Ensete ventricosum]|nr:hypothetical protein BHM03_00046688 [Ensete ventricosum]